jgi:octopine/nopaline transport system substrate-binding protein
MHTLFRRALLGLALAFAAAPAMAETPTDVKIGVEGAFPPWNMTLPDGKLAGLDIDLANDLCTRMKVHCTLISGEWSSLIPSLNAGKFDAVLSVGINETRKKVVDFTVPYASGAASFMIQKSGSLKALPDTGKPLNLNDHAAADPVMEQIKQALKGKTVGVVQSTSHEQLIHAYFGNDVSVRTYKSSQDRDLDLAAGRIDVAFDSAVYAMTTADKPGNQDIMASGPLIRGAMLATNVAIALRKDEPDLRAKFDEAIRAAAADGTIRKLSVKWSKIDLTPEAPAQ